MEKTKRLSASMGEILYLLFFGSLLFAKGIGLYDGQAIFKLVLVFAAICLALKLATDKYTTGEMLKIFAVIVLTASTYLVSGEKGMLLYGMMMVGLKYVDVKKVFLTGCILWTIAFLGITLFSLLRMDETVYKVHSKLGLGHIFRWSLGYPHPNVLQVSYLILAVFFIYLLGDTFRLKHAFWLFAGNMLIFMYSVSYTGFIVFMCLLLGRIYLLFRKKLCLFEKLLLQLVFPACVLVSLIVPVTIDVNGKWFKLFNKIFSQRLELGWLYLIPENISLWGKRLAEITNSSKTMDNAYLFAFITYGAIPFAFICIASMYMLYRYLKDEKYIEALIIVSITIGGMTEPFLYNTSFKNLSFLFMGVLLFGNKEEGKEWRIIPWERLGIQIPNGQMEIKTGQIRSAAEKFRCVFWMDFRKVLAGLLLAGFLVIITGRFSIYPDGYVVYRTDCSEIPQERTYYDESNPDYVTYKKMHPFKQGEEIEYFGGNIVMMEKIRDKVAVIVLGYTAGYILMGSWMALQDRKKKAKEAANEK